MTSAPSKPQAPPLRYVQSIEMKPTEYVRNAYRFTPSKDVSIEDLLRPHAFAHVIGDLSLKAGDIIEATAPDMSWYVELIVRHVEGPEIHVGIIVEQHFKPICERARDAA